MKKKFCIGIVLMFFSSVLIASDIDARSYQHGIDFISRPDGTDLIIWSSSGIPPTGKNLKGNWTHDVFYTPIDPITSSPGQAIKIISNPEAQEPASSAISSDGHIMITMEDGWKVENQVGQRFGVYDHKMKPLKPYPNLVQDGGHSGHVTAVNNQFVIFYSDEWVDGGGVDDLGSGSNVLLKVYDSNGNQLRSKEITTGETTRDWWPLLAGSRNHAMLLWQRFVDDQTYADLIFAVYDPTTGQLLKEATKLTGFIKYYSYNIQFISAIKRFLVIGTDQSGGFAFLLDDKGTVTAKNILLPAGIREAQPAIFQQAGKVTVAYPMHPGGVMVLALGESSITLENMIFDKFNWPSIGIDGIFLNKQTALFMSLSAGGLVATKINIAK